MMLALLALVAAPQDSTPSFGDADYFAELSNDGYIRYLKYPVLVSSPCSLLSLWASFWDHSP